VSTQILTTAAVEAKIAGTSRAQQWLAWHDAQPMTGYLVGDQIQTWTGDLLIRVTSRVTRKMGGFAGAHTRVYWRGVDPTGRHWYGSSPGDHMYTHCRPRVQS
jgi:hypothetical protein